jgi:hypothetical protein
LKTDLNWSFSSSAFDLLSWWSIQFFFIPATPILSVCFDLMYFQSGLLLPSCKHNTDI